MVGCLDGGVDIETIAEQTPDRIIKVPVDILTGPTNEQTEEMARKLGFVGDKAVEVCFEEV